MKGPSPKLLLKITISIGLLAFLLTTTGLDDVLRRLSHANLWYVPVGIGIYLISQAISSWRWQFLASALGFRLSLREYYDYYLIGMYLSLFLPGSIGGDAGRMYYLAKSAGRKKREALLTLLAERGVGLVALLMLTTLLCLTPVAAPVPALIRAGLIAMSAAGLLGFAALQVVPVSRWAERHRPLALLEQAQVYWKNRPLLAQSVSISLLVHGCMVLIHWLIAEALGVRIALPYLAVVYGLVSLASVLPIAFNGIGVREGAYLYLLTRGGLTPEAAMAFGLYWFLISTATSLIGGLVLMKGHYKTPVAAEVDVLEP